MIGSGMVVRSIPYKEGFGGKQMAWIVHAGIMGAVVAPLCLLGGPLLTRAAWYTAGVVGGGFLWSPFVLCYNFQSAVNKPTSLAVKGGVGVTVHFFSMEHN